MEDRIRKIRTIIYVLAAAAILAVVAAYCALPKGVSSIAVYADDEKTDETVSMYEGTSEVLTVKVEPRSFSDRRAVYLVSDESVITVSENGEVSALKPGESLVTIQVAGAKTSVNVSVERAVKDIEGVDESIAMTEGYGYSIEAKVVMAAKGLDAPKLKFKSADESIATVDKDGYISAVAPGETTITVSAGGVKKEITATVEARPVPTPAPKKTGGTKKQTTTSNDSDSDDGGGWEG